MAKTSHQTTSDYLLSTSREYSIYVCSTRAIPSVEDGLKNGQRMALWLLRNRADKIKTVALSGLLAAEKIYVHGEASANNAISLLAAPYKNNFPLIEGIGQFGSRTSPVEGIGAPRYTEVRRSKISQALLYADLESVPLEDNYDGSTKQPKHFNPLIPLVLLNGVEGVAVGWSTMILPHSLKSIIENTISATKGEKMKPMAPHFERYDVSISSAGEANKWEIRGKARINSTSDLTILEIPPGIDVDAFRKRLIDMEEEGTIEDFTEHSTDQINIDVRMKRGSIKGWTEDKVLDFFKLKQRVTQRIVCVGWGGNSIITYDDPRDLIADFVKFRLGVYVDRYNRLLAETSDELIFWKLLRGLFTRGFMKKLGTFATKDAMLMEVTKVAEAEKIAATERHLDRAISLPTYRWTKDFEAEVLNKITALEADIKDFTAILKSKDRINQIYITELEAVKSGLKTLITV